MRDIGIMIDMIGCAILFEEDNSETILDSRMDKKRWYLTYL